MTTIKITARDSSTAMEEVSKKLGTEAFILSTSSKEGGVEIEATNDPAELKKYSDKPKRKFSNLIKKELSNVSRFPLPKPGHQGLSKVPNYTELHSNAVNPDLSLLNKNITQLTNEIRGMYITGSGGLGAELGESTFIKLEQAGFKAPVLKTLNPSFNGLNYERGRIAFMTALGKSLSFDCPRNGAKRITFVNGLSGVGKTILTAKMIASQKESHSDDIVVATLADSSDPPEDSLRSFARMLNTPVLKLYQDNLLEQLCSIKGKIVIDVSLRPSDSIGLIQRSIDFLTSKEVSSVVAVPGGSSGSFIRGQANLFRVLEPEIALTKLDECDITANEMSEFFINSMKIHYLTGSKSIVGGLSTCNSEILTQYLIENC